MRKEQAKKQERRKELLKEYELTQQMAIHYDALNWQIGSILIAGIFISIGIIGDRFDIYPLLSAISLFILIIWNRFYFRHKAIQDTKFERLHSIENELNLRQHLIVRERDAQKKLNGLHSKNIVHILTFGIPFTMLVCFFLNQI